MPRPIRRGPWPRCSAASAAGRGARSCSAADRGRGKSAALGIAAARALTEVPGIILVTGPDPGAADTVLTHGRAQARALGEDPDRIRFVPVDRVPAADASVRALLVDEAAALPVALLGRWLRDHGRVALATTVHGYEGTGRGFELRLRGLLDRFAPDWRRVELAEPVRFAAGDPLEALQFALLALDADPVPPEPVATPDAELIPAGTLATDETALRALFGLLVSAHYQTRPSDLVRMLDDPAMRVWHLGPARAPLACALTIDEGGLDPMLAAAMAAGTRQPRGEQGPGVLARRLGLEAGARIRSVRISRITVHPAGPPPRPRQAAGGRHRRRCPQPRRRAGDLQLRRHAGPDRILAPGRGRSGAAGPHPRSRQRRTFGLRPARPGCARRSAAGAGPDGIRRRVPGSARRRPGRDRTAAGPQPADRRRPSRRPVPRRPGPRRPLGPGRGAAGSLSRRPAPAAAGAALRRAGGARPGAGCSGDAGPAAAGLERGRRGTRGRGARGSGRAVAAGVRTRNAG
ncbi:MAG: hypothetical protein U5R48_10240 [Gammaproteobacteria bacterium]|nr:hypothetical protein [Gammaproteobacteria bacterium]